MFQPRLPLCLALSLLLAGCITSATHFSREDVATRVAAPAWMVDRVISAPPFNLMAFERMHKRFTTANIYIEGDGEALAWMSPDPTPDYPVSLHLAAYDKAENVAWIARPCQYTGLSDGSDCDDKMWTQGMYAPEVFDAYNKAIDDVIVHYDIRGINLIAFDGGAPVAAELIRRRSDILSLRTVAGKMSKVAIVPQLANIPQRHFIGGQDDEVIPQELHDYMQALGPTSCLHYSFIQENEHEDGWAEKWPQLLAEPLDCAPAPVPEFHVEDLAPKHYYTPRDTSFKDFPK